MKHLILFILVLFTLNLSAQTTKNVTFRQQGNKIIVNYDLSGNDLFQVDCSYSIDNGKTFIPLKSVTGDIGNNIYPGKSKEIIWNVFKDRDGIQGEIQFKVVARAQNESRQFYISAKTGFSDGYLISGQFGFFGKRKIGTGISYQVTEVQINNDSHEFVWFYKHIISPIVSLKLIDSRKYQLIGSIQSGLSITNQLTDDYASVKLFDNFNIDLRQNLGRHVQLIIGYASAKSDYAYSTINYNTGDYESHDYSKKNKYFSFGIGYTF